MGGRVGVEGRGGGGGEGQGGPVSGYWGYRCIKLGHQIQGVIIGIAKGY